MKIFTLFADWLTYTIFSLQTNTRLAESIHFFIEDTSKIFILLFIMIYIISWLRAGLDTEVVKQFLSGKKRGVAYVIASLFGAITPFCSCSSIPLFLGFTSAGIPLGITMAFLITSPMINEVALVILGASSVLGVRFMLIYLAIGITSGILGGWFFDLIGAEKYLSPLGQKAKQMEGTPGVSIETSKIKGFRGRHQFAVVEWKSILKRIWIWVIAGVGLGALIHGLVPEDFFIEHLGQKQWWSVPSAVFLGIPLYSNASGVIPVMESLIQKGVPIGTAMAFMMSIVAASFPEFMMLKQVMKPRLLIIFFLVLLVFFTLAGWVINGMM